MLLQELSEIVVPAFWDVINELTTGYLERTYQNAMHLALEDRGLRCEREVVTAVRYRGRVVGEHRLDLVVERQIVIECKATPKILPAHEAQLLHYLKSTGMKVGFVMNFGPSPAFSRRVYDTANDESIRRSAERSGARQNELETACRERRELNGRE